MSKDSAIDASVGQDTWKRAVPLLAWGGRVLLSALFLWAAVGKIIDPQEFSTAIANYQLLPAAVVPPLAVGLPVFEVILSLTLLWPPLHRGSALLTGLMLWMFAGAMLQAQMRGIDLDCGCFGTDTPVAVGADTILRNLALGSLALWIALRKGSQFPKP